MNVDSILMPNHVRLGTGVFCFGSGEPRSPTGFWEDGYPFYKCPSRGYVYVAGSRVAAVKTGDGQARDEDPGRVREKT